MKQLRDCRGASLIQVLMAASALAGLSLLGVKMGKDQEKLVASTSQNYEMAYLVKEVQYLLSDPASCRASLAGLSPRQQKKRLKNLYREVPGQTGTSRVVAYPITENGKNLYGQNDLELIGYSLSDKGKEVSMERGTTFLELHFDKGQNAFGHSKFVKKIKLSISLQEGRIADCKTYEGPSFSFWKQSEKKLIYKNGNVGVGREPRFGSLEVEGGLFIKEASDQDCRPEISGVISKSSSGRLQFCLPGMGWRPLKYKPIDYKNASRYELALTKTGMVEHSAIHHRQCVLSGFQKKGFGFCYLSQQSGSWIFRGELSRTPGKVICEVSCYD